ncbi:hypothetical protein DICPUDRAFT_42396 [Dictyostelium purpureum]|uniref:Uncharacterized protein n=1 Tax=Dictyostelium purpureum TaxID=5786 RepID=F1A202_DICPU|nr:uncharacterized protein DICPUDRAFT_42396 [Dictyostelium purpureum]XP_003294317.1 uncharacterized protein DICPUDRAFT_43260 [Dictyostelium purpureum]EGC29150.1 hypothetical protein DICPUDRAFT_43260 [Dictyostelium purpureum]EGC29784.1 hypothetical protein DICPUDRAFT_42396 [Dictyostelium purpureum]|eukprot:XP_003293692.1 hypothetical protein DICPUDRAFT_42396 [Dictyostelium purpureum]
MILFSVSISLASDEDLNSNGDVDCYSSCVDENRDVCKTEWQQCVSLMERCRTNCDKTSKKMIQMN